MTYSKKSIEFGIIRADPLPNEHDLMKYYETKYYQQSNGNKTSYDSQYHPDEIEHKILESNIAIEALKNCLGNSVADNVLVEFGCGEGFFLKQALQSFKSVQGIDFSRYAIQKWHPNLEKFCLFGDFHHQIEDYIQKNKLFDVCVLRNVLEHVIDPSVLLNSLKLILKPNGLLLIKVPNDFSALQAMAISLGHVSTEDWFEPPDHLYYFNTQNIQPFLQDLGFKIIDMYSSFPVDFFLFHPGSNYINNRQNGKAAHFARIHLDILMSRSGIPQLLNLYRSMAKCGVGRDFTVILKHS